MDVGIVGVGTIGRKVARELDKGTVPGVQVTAFNSRDLAKAETFAATLASPPRVVSLEELPPLCDLVIETAGANTVERTSWRWPVCTASRSTCRPAP